MFKSDMIAKPREIIQNFCLLFSMIFTFFLSFGDSLNITSITETAETGPEPIGNIDEK
ncbi:MAG: hypothetical protein GWN41_05765 [Phycisphaerae bacterium]|nr:hypothetical protein [Phycisphaerae bacterium]